MFYCPKCQNIFNISKDLVNDQIGSGQVNYEFIIKSIIEDDINEEVKKIISRSDFSLEDLSKHPDFRKFGKIKKDIIYNKINDLIPETNISEDNKTEMFAYFNCKNCAYTEPIEPGTKIYSKSSSNVNSDFKYMKYSDIIPYTRKYTCPNKECKSHTDFTKKEAKFFRVHNTFKVKYICLACDTIF